MDLATLTPASEARLASVEPMLQGLRADVLLAMRMLDHSDTRGAHMRLSAVALALSDAIDAVER